MKHASPLHRPASRLNPVFVACALACASPAAFACDATDTTTLTACIANAAPGGTVRLLNNITLTSHTGLITTDLTIDGQGFTLDGAGTHRGFFVDRGTVTVQNITLQNLRAKGGDGGGGSLYANHGSGGGGGMGAGGALFVRSGSAVVIRDVNLIGSSALGGTGGTSRVTSSNELAFSSGAGGGLGGDGAGSPNGSNGYAGHGGGGTFEDGGKPVPYQFYPWYWGAGGAGGGAAGGSGASAMGGGQPIIAAGNGGDHGGGGGGGPLRTEMAAGNGGFGGGGGSSPMGPAGNGGFGGGAGATGAMEYPVALAGFGGGGAGRRNLFQVTVPRAPGGFGGGSGGVTQENAQGQITGYGGGGGGAGMGGAVFVMEGASITFEGTVNLDGSTVTGGAGGNRAYNGGTDGQAFGPGIFLQGSSAVIVFNPAAGAVQTLADGMADQTGSGGTGGNAGSIGIAKTGTGLLVLDGEHRYTGGTTVHAGRLAVNGSIQGPTTVRAGAELGGSGSVGSASVQTGGRLAPGNSIGTLTVNGDLSFAPGSVFDVEVNPTAADRVDVSGTVTIAGGTVQVRAGAGSYARRTDYTILSATSGLSGTFEGVSTDLAFLVPTLVYGPNGLVLRLSTSEALRYEHVARTDNQAAVARHLDTFAEAPPNADAQALIAALDNMNTAQAVTALTGLNGSVHSAATLAAISVGVSFAQALAERSGFGQRGLSQAAPALALRLQPQAPTRPRAVLRAAGMASPSGPQTWALATGASATLPGDGNGPSSRHSASGVVVGQDAWISPTWWLGAALGNSRSRWRADTQGTAPANGHIDSWNAGLYAHHHWGEQQQWRLRLDTTWTLHRFDTQRAVDLGGLPLSAASQHRGQEVALGAQVEHAQHLGTEGSGWQLRHSAGLRHAHLREKAFTETGAAPANLSVRERSHQGTVASTGVRWEYTGGEGREAYLGLEASHRLGDLDAPVIASLAGQSATFLATGTPLRRTAVTLRLGGTVPLSTQVSLYGGASAEWRGAGQNSNAVSIGLRFAW